MKIHTQHHYGDQNGQDAHTDQEQEVYHYKHLPQLARAYSVHLWRVGDTINHRFIVLSFNLFCDTVFDILLQNINNVSKINW